MADNEATHEVDATEKNIREGYVEEPQEEKSYHEPRPSTSTAATSSLVLSKPVSSGLICVVANLAHPHYPISLA